MLALLTHLVNVLIEVIIEIMRRLLPIESGVDSSNRKNRSRIVQRIPNGGIVGVPAHRLIESSRLWKLQRHSLVLPMGSCSKRCGWTNDSIDRPSCPSLRGSCVPVVYVFFPDILTQLLHLPELVRSDAAISRTEGCCYTICVIQLHRCNYWLSCARGSDHKVLGRGGIPDVPLHGATRSTGW